MSLHYSDDLKSMEDFLSGHRHRETKMRRALQRILSAAEGDTRFESMNWSDVAEVARQALQQTEVDTQQAKTSMLR
ncbi:MAG: hypothetical protein RIC14_01780 [Filomicrobium sp.]